MGILAGWVQSPRGSLTCLQIPATVCFQLQRFSFQALIDSGAEENFIDEQAAEQAGIPSEPLERPRNALAVDGRILAQVTHRTLPVKLVLSGNHVESIQLLVISSPATPLIIGYPWLATHNPHMDWAVGKVLSWSLYCHKHCLQSALSPTGEAPTPHSPLIEPVDLSGVPPAYHDLQEVFNKDKTLSLPPHRPYDCAIELLPDAPLPSSRLYNLTRPEQEAMEGYINDSMAAGIIRPSTSPVGIPLSLPFKGATIFTKLDLRNAYHLVRIREGDEWKTAFNTPLGHFEYLVMPFGLTNAPAVFQALINDVLRDFLNRFVFVYLDDILIYSRNLPNHQLHVRQVLQRLLENRLFVKKEKCEFHASQVDFLGFGFIKEGCVQADPDLKAKVRAVAEWPIPTNRKLLQRFLGFANFYRRFIRNYSQEAAPLTALTSPSRPFVWSEEAEKAFNRLRTLFTTAPVLVQPDPAQQLNRGRGGSCRPITTSVSRELLAVKMALEEWRHWLEGSTQPFVVWTDHKNLAYIQTAKRLNSRQARWALFFSRFDFVLTYRPGSRNIKPDALSRQFSVEENILPTSRVIAAITWDIENAVLRAQQQQPDPRQGPPGRLFVPGRCPVTSSAMGSLVQALMSPRHQPYHQSH
ncbi:hypothetical protein L3Q82_026217 [Scortum barcoo]|uniref:Uncharacterized protein n=1 Tax=Scortum barcoo TaxID=214431 RepID=A0ACB8WIZ1_9TELE|nr:hypothetical protein L3Q82_026217 [Scortum barcoo]